jgi:hypothetical protein
VTPVAIRPPTSPRALPTPIPIRTRSMNCLIGLATVRRRLETNKYSMRHPIPKPIVQKTRTPTSHGVVGSQNRHNRYPNPKAHSPAASRGFVALCMPVPEIEVSGPTDTRPPLDVLHQNNRTPGSLIVLARSSMPICGESILTTSASSFRRKGIRDLQAATQSGFSGPPC